MVIGDKMLMRFGNGQDLVVLFSVILTRRCPLRFLIITMNIVFYSEFRL